MESQRGKNCVIVQLLMMFLLGYMDQSRFLEGAFDKNDQVYDK